MLVSSMFGRFSVSWWSTVPLLMAIAAIFFFPGALIAWASGVRGFAFVALSPALTVTVVSVAAMVAPLLGFRWSLLPVIGFAVVVAVVAFVVVRFLVRDRVVRVRRERAWRLPVAELVAVLLGAFLVGRRLVYVFGRPESFSQTFDNVFHLNAIRFILDTGSASSVTVSSMTGGGFYPAAWHDIVALLVTVTGAQIPVAVNVVNIGIGALVWPVACIYLVQQIMGRRALPTLMAGILAAAFGSFPILMLDFGVLYPNVLAISLLPIALGAGLQALGLARGKSQSSMVRWLLFAAVLPGLSLAHPSSTMALLALLVPPLLGMWWRAVALRLPAWRSQWKALLLWAVFLVMGTAIVFVLWKKVRPPEAAATWAPFQTTGRAIGELIAMSQIGRPVSWVVMILVLVGLVKLISGRQQLWLVGMYGVLGGLFVIVTSFPFGPLRTFFTGVWYNDSPRLAALLPVLAVPLAVVGGSQVLVWAGKKWGAPLRVWIGRRTTMDSSKLRYGSFVLVAVLLGALTVGTQQANVRAAAVAAAPGYQIGKDSPLVSSDELALIDRLDSHVPANAVLVGNPWNGSALVYALADRKMVQLHILSELPAGAQEIYDHLDQALSDPDVCPAVRSLNVHYVLDFGHHEVHGGDNGFRGLDNLAASGVATLIDSQGAARLYELTVCK